MTTKRSLFDSFPMWVRAFTPEARSAMAAIARERLRRTNPITSSALLTWDDDVLICNLLFHVNDRTAIVMMIDAYRRNSAIFSEREWLGA